MMPRRIHLRFADSRTSTVLIGSSLFDDIAIHLGSAGAAPKRIAVVRDRNVPEAFSQAIQRSAASSGIACIHRIIRADEPSKGLAHFQTILEFLAEHKLERSDAVVALGGGVTGDLAGFAAATYRRGLTLVQCPSTLLAMVDASIGGKTGVNLTVTGSLKKNLVGAFHQPLLVLADLDLLNSLDRRQLRSGFAECIKHSMICRHTVIHHDLWEWTASNAASISNGESVTLAELISRNIEIKREFVLADEHETAPDDFHLSRAFLNLGHTFGHAIEPLPEVRPAAGGHPPLLHGEAVSLGLLCASRLAVHCGRADRSLPDALSRLLFTLGLPTTAAGLPTGESILDLMRHDKKSLSGRLRFIIPTEPGRAEILSDPPERAVLDSIESIRA